MSDTVNILDKFGRDVTQLSRKFLQSSPRRTKHKRINTTGNLSKSIRHKISRSKDGIEMVFAMEDYGIHMDRGVMGSKRRILKYWNKSMFLPRGPGYQNNQTLKGMPPVRKIEQWASKKPVDGNPFAISLAIKRNGIGPTLFFTDAFEQYEEDLPDDILVSVGDQIEEELKDS